MFSLDLSNFSIKLVYRSSFSISVSKSDHLSTIKIGRSEYCMELIDLVTIGIVFRYKLSHVLWQSIPFPFGDIENIDLDKPSK